MISLSGLMWAGLMGVVLLLWVYSHRVPAIRFVYDLKAVQEDTFKSSWVTLWVYAPKQWRVFNSLLGLVYPTLAPPRRFYIHIRVKGDISGFVPHRACLVVNNKRRILLSVSKEKWYREDLKNDIRSMVISPVPFDYDGEPIQTLRFYFDYSLGIQSLKQLNHVKICLVPER